jgi:hypothetical protein
MYWLQIVTLETVPPYGKLKSGRSDPRQLGQEQTTLHDFVESLRHSGHDLRGECVWILC